MGKSAGRIKKLSLADLIPDDRNANKGTPRGIPMIESSISRDGFGRSVLVDKNGKIIAGNKTIESVANTLGTDAPVLVIQTDGHQVVVVQRDDLDLDDPDPNNSARRLAYVDNLSSHFSFELDPNVLMADIEKGFDFDAIEISLGDLGDLLGPAIDKLLGEMNDPWDHWQDMPEYDQPDSFGAYASIKVHFRDQDALDDFSARIGQKINKKSVFIWHPKQTPMDLKSYQVVDDES